MMMKSYNERCCDDVMKILTTSASAEYIGEEVSQLEHALQCAYWAKRACPHDEEMVLSALLHDIGHICVNQKETLQMGSYGIDKHEKLGAAFLAKLGFSKRVQELVKGHVEAKRYLVFKNPEYQARLSEASQQTLLYQGGAMSDEEAKAFEADQLFKEKLQVRYFDELAKDKGRDVDSLDSYRDMLLRHMNCHSTIEPASSIFG